MTAASEDGRNFLSFGQWTSDLEWEVTHKKSKVHKGRGSSPEAALRDLRDSWKLGVADAQENLDREQKRLGKLDAMLADTEEPVPDGIPPGFSPGSW